MTWTDISFKLKCLIFGKTTANQMKYIDEAYDRAFPKKKSIKSTPTNIKNRLLDEIDKDLDKERKEDQSFSKELKSILRSMLDSKQRLIENQKNNNAIKHKKWHLCKRCHDVTIPLEDFHCDKCYRIVLARWLS